jgi:hypothetical protein
VDVARDMYSKRQLRCWDRTTLHRYGVLSLCLWSSTFLTTLGNYFLRDGYVNSLDFIPSSRSHNLKTPSDLTCPAEGCRSIPLLRSPEVHNPATWFCTSCKGDGSGESFALISACLTFRLCNSPSPRHWSESVGTATPFFT